MNGIYESIMAGLNEAVADARGEIKPLERHTVELPDRTPLQGPFPPVVSGVAAAGMGASVPA